MWVCFKGTTVYIVCRKLYVTIHHHQNYLRIYVFFPEKSITTPTPGNSSQYKKLALENSHPTNFIDFLRGGYGYFLETHDGRLKKKNKEVIIGKKRTDYERLFCNLDAFPYDRLTDLPLDAPPYTQESTVLLLHIHAFLEHVPFLHLPLEPRHH